MGKLIPNRPEDIKEELLAPMNIEKELLAEIQEYRDKEKRWEDSELNRMIKAKVVLFIICSSFIWFIIMMTALILPSILPSNHREWSAINAGFLLAGVLLGVFDIAALWFEKRSIAKTSLEYFETRVAVDEKAQGLLNQLKKDRDVYLQNTDEELKESFRTLSMLAALINFFMFSAILNYLPLGESYVAWLFYFAFVFLGFAAQICCRRKAGPVRISIEHESEGKEMIQEKDENTDKKPTI